MLPLNQPDKFLDQPIASGKRLQFATLKMVIEIVDFPSYNMVDLSSSLSQL
jgi:hypothetical protein